MTTTKTFNESDLRQFTGNETWYRHTLARAATGKPITYTEGVKYVADTAGAYWLVDEVAFGQANPIIAAEEFQAWKLEVDLEKSTGKLSVDDGNGNIVFSKEIPYTDFPLKEFSLWYTGCVIMLPSEY